MRTLNFIGGVAFVACASAIAIADPTPLSGPARVIDGDTIAFGDQRVRLWGVDAFEADQLCHQPPNVTYACGRAATQTLEELVRNQHVTCTQRGMDRYKRIVAQCFAQGHDLASIMVWRGWAFVDARYSKGYYAGQQDGAKEMKRGAWKGAFQWPWDYRRANIDVYSGKPNLKEE